MLTRRGLITGLVGFVAAPSIVRCSSLMSLRGVPLAVASYSWDDVVLGYVKRRAIEEGGGLRVEDHWVSHDGREIVSMREVLEDHWVLHDGREIVSMREVLEHHWVLHDGREIVYIDDVSGTRLRRGTHGKSPEGILRRGSLL